MLLDPTAGEFSRVVSINGSTPKWSAIEINDWPILLRWSSLKVHAYGIAHMFPTYCWTWGLLHFSEECGWQLLGIGVLNQPNYLGLGTSAAYRLLGPWTLVGLVLLRNLIGCWACVQLTPLCVIQHQGPSQFVSKFLWPSSESRICDFHALVLGAAGSFKPNCRQSGIPQSLHWLQQQVFKLPSKRAPRSKRSIGDVKWLDLLMFFPLCYPNMI